MKKTKILAISAAAFTLAAGAYWWSGRSSRKGEAQSSRLVEARLGSLEKTVEATGEVAPLNRVEIKPPISGRVEEILADEGASVKQGQILAWMSSSDRAAIIDAARAQGPEAVKRWEDTYKPTPIVAPLSGVVILKNVVVGQTVDAGSVLFALSDRLIVLAHVDEVDIGRIREGLPARITLDAYADMTIPGKVFNILFEGKNVSNVITYGVKVAPEKTPPFFRSQMTANVSFLLDRKENVLLLPAAAVREKEGGKEVLVPGPGKKPEPRAVTTGLENGDQVEITSGLAAGEKVIISQRRYVPQQGVSSSPLVMGGNRPQERTGPGGSGGRSGGGGGRP